MSNEVVDVSSGKRVWPLVQRPCIWNQRFNADGLLRTAQQGERDRASTLFFRNGSVEYLAHVGGLLMNGTKVTGTTHDVQGMAIEDHIIHAVKEFGRVVLDAGAALPLAVVGSLLGLAGYNLGGHGTSVTPNFTVDRHVITLTDVLVEDVERPEAALKPLFDHMWQCCNYPGSQSYDSNGKFRSLRVLREDS